MAYISRLIEKNDDTLTIRVFQVSPDYSLDTEEFVLDYGGMALFGWAYEEGEARTDRGHSAADKTTGTRLEPSEEVADVIGSAPIGVGADELDEHVEIVSQTLVKPPYNDDNRDERLAEAGLAGKELFRTVVMQIAGQLDIVIEDKAGLFGPLEVDTEWTY